MLANARLGLGGSLVLRGERGSGKTSLLAYAAEHAAELTVAQSTGLQSEMELDFAALHGLLAPFRTQVDLLPGPQRHALRAAFGLVSAATSDRFLVGLAVLSLLTEAAEDRPVLVAIDEAHWLDDATADVLAFVARRLSSTPVAFVIAVREPTTRVQSLDGLPSLHLPTIHLRHESASVDASTSALAMGYWGAGALLDSSAGRSVASRAEWGVPDQDNGADPAVSSTNMAINAAGGDGADELTHSQRLDDRITADAGASPALANYALAILDLGKGRYSEALARALKVFDEDPPKLGTQILPDLVEAAVRSGDMGAAASALERLSERTRSSGTHLASGLLARSTALLTEDAEALYREAIEYLRQSDSGVDLARAHLLYGEWLRRRRRRRDAREQLRAAQELFNSVGFAPFAHRASVELHATSESVRKRRGQAGDTLTSQEAEIAALVAEGLSNRQVAAQLFISQNTVEYHLQKVFRKIGVSSRTQLARAILDQSRGDEAPAAITARSPLTASRPREFGRRPSPKSRDLIGGKSLR